MSSSSSGGGGGGAMFELFNEDCDNELGWWMMVAVEEVGDEDVSVEICVRESSRSFESLSSSRGGGGGRSSNFSWSCCCCCGGRATLTGTGAGGRGGCGCPPLTILGSVGGTTFCETILGAMGMGIALACGC